MNYPDAETQFKKLQSQILNCQECPSGSGKTELGWGAFKEVMFVGQCPAMTNSEGLRGTSDFDKFFLDAIKLFGLNETNIYFTNLIKKPQPNMKDLSQATLHHCAEHVLDEYIFVNPRILILMGRYPRRFTKIKNHEELFHLGAIRYGKRTLDEWQGELERILRNNLLLTNNKYNYGKR